MNRGRIKELLLKYNTIRRIAQLLVFVFFSSMIFGLGSQPLLLPVLWTWGLQTNIVGDAFTAVQIMLFDPAFPWLAIASFLTIGILLGKSMCGWVCPFGFVQDLIGFIKRRKNDFSRRTHDNMVYAKYLVLSVALFISSTFAISRLLGVSRNYGNALGKSIEAPFTALSPSETLFAALPSMIKGFRLGVVEKPMQEVIGGIANLAPFFWVQFVILVSVLVFVAFVPRGWCRYFCPHGAIMAVLNNFSLIGLRRDPAKCARGGCRLCVDSCPMRVPILNLPWEKFSHPECIYCMKCVDACKDKAVRLKYP